VGLRGSVGVGRLEIPNPSATSLSVGKPDDRGPVSTACSESAGGEARGLVAAPARVAAQLPVPTPQQQSKRSDHAKHESFFLLRPFL
jgi:hypothetical protein